MTAVVEGDCKTELVPVCVTEDESDISADDEDEWETLFVTVLLAQFESVMDTAGDLLEDTVCEDDDDIFGEDEDEWETLFDELEDS